MENLAVIFLFYCIAVANGLPFALPVTKPIILNHQLNAESFTKFQIYTPENSKKPDNFNISSIPKTHFNKNRKTIILIHGFSGTDYLTPLAKTACFKNGEHNVNLIGIDWTKGASDPIYVHAAHRVQHVGKVVGKFIAQAADEGLINSNNVELIGHSLGAHASGFAGKYLKEMNRPSIPLIIGLDPAGPLFRNRKQKLHKNDARKVIVIHTNSDYGHLEPLGDVDIYLNGGKKQPGLNDQQSHCFAAEFYKGLVNIDRPLIGHRYSSFDEVKNGEIPKTEEINLFHGEPIPHDPLIYVNSLSESQKSLMPEFEELDPTKKPPPSSLAEVRDCISCSITCFATDFRRGLVNMKNKNGEVPKTEDVNLFHGEPVPHLSESQKRLMPKFQELDPPKNPLPSILAKARESIGRSIMGKQTEERERSNYYY